MFASTAFKFLISEFEKKNIPLLVIGGFAVNIYKVNRATSDLDFLIGDGNYAKAEEVLKEAGYKEEVIGRAFARWMHPDETWIDIDFLFVSDDIFKEMFEKAQEVEIAENRFRVPCLEHLIALKLHALKSNFVSREDIDLPDIVNLSLENQFDLESEKSRELCFKYGTKELYEILLNKFKGKKNA